LQDDKDRSDYFNNISEEFKTGDLLPVLLLYLLTHSPSCTGINVIDTLVATESKAIVNGDEDDVSSTISFGSLGSYPEFSKDTDNLHAEGLHNITDAHSVRTALSNPSEIAAIMLVLAKVKERVQVRTYLLNY